MPQTNAKPPDLLKLFGLHLSALRKAQGLSQEGLAYESGLARSYVGGIERGQRNLALLNICRLAEALELPPSELLNFPVPAARAPSSAAGKRSAAKQLKKS